MRKFLTLCLSLVCTMSFAQKAEIETYYNEEVPNHKVSVLEVGEMKKVDVPRLMTTCEKDYKKAKQSLERENMFIQSKYNGSVLWGGKKFKAAYKKACEEAQSKKDSLDAIYSPAFIALESPQNAFDCVSNDTEYYGRLLKINLDGKEQYDVVYYATAQSTMVYGSFLSLRENNYTAAKVAQTKLGETIEEMSKNYKK